MNWKQHTIIRILLLTAKTIARWDKDEWLQDEIKTLANHIQVGAPFSDKKD